MNEFFKTIIAWFLIIFGVLGILFSAFILIADPFNFDEIMTPIQNDLYLVSDTLEHSSQATIKVSDSVDSMGSTLRSTMGTISLANKDIINIGDFFYTDWRIVGNLFNPVANKFYSYSDSITEVNTDLNSFHNDIYGLKNKVDDVSVDLQNLSSSVDNIANSFSDVVSYTDGFLLLLSLYLLLIHIALLLIGMTLLTQ